jgi:signal transduction histidine kinase
MRSLKSSVSHLTSHISLLRWDIPLGLQLSTLYTLLLVVTLSVVGSLVYSQQESFLVQDAALRLEQEATRIVAIPSPLSQQPGGGGGQFGPGGGGKLGQGNPGGPQGETAEYQLTENLVRGLSGQGVTVAVLDTSGSIITTTQALSGGSAPIIDPVTPAQVADALKSNRPLQWITTRSDGSRDVVVLMSVTQTPHEASGQGGNDQPVTLLVEQSAPLAGTDAALERLRTYLLAGVIGGTIAGVVLVLLFTRGVLRSLDRVVDTADAIASGDLHRRLQLPAGRNEVARLGKAFDYMVSRLVAALEAQRRFIADASHELRTPLTSLKGLAEILVIGAHGDDSRVIEQSAQAINGELDRLIHLVTDLLTLSRLNSTSGGPAQAARHTRMDICTTMSAAVTQMARQAEMHGVNLRQECAGPLWMVGDAGQIKQVLLNLIDNALRYTPSGGEVTLTASEAELSAMITVQDTGSGIDERDLPHVFERFYRGDVSRTRATGNSGLGLAIVKEIVEAHSGSIEVESALGAGTCFTIMLPLAKESKAHEEPAEPATV